MIRTITAMILLAAVTAQAASAPMPAPAAAPATQPSVEELHARAYELMRAGDFDKATPLLHRAYVLTPPAQRGRALVLNRALLDLVQRHSSLHGARELTDYLLRNPKHDEAALSILGSLLDVAVDNEKWRKTTIYNAAYREFSRREATMERLRPGFRRWGPRWITEEEWQEIRRQEREIIREMQDLSAKLKRLDDGIKAQTAQMAVARRRVSAFGWHSHGTDPNVPVYIGNCVNCDQHRGVREAVNDLMADIHAATLELQPYKKRYDELKEELEKLRPDWPARYDPIDPAAPPPPEPANPPLPATVPAEAAEPTE